MIYSTFAKILLSETKHSNRSPSQRAGAKLITGKTDELFRIYHHLFHEPTNLIFGILELVGTLEKDLMRTMRTRKPVS
jgi:hypothetical protein